MNDGSIIIWFFKKAIYHQKPSASYSTCFNTKWILNPSCWIMAAGRDSRSWKFLNSCTTLGTAFILRQSLRLWSHNCWCQMLILITSWSIQFCKSKPLQCILLEWLHILGTRKNESMLQNGAQNMIFLWCCSKQSFFVSLSINMAVWKTSNAFTGGRSFDVVIGLDAHLLRCVKNKGVPYV